MKVFFEPTHLPLILDLEGTVPFDVSLCVRLALCYLSQPLNILIDDSVFDIPQAFAKGLLRLIDSESNEPVDLSFTGASPQEVGGSRIITLPIRTSPLPLFKADLVVSLRLRLHLKEAFVADRKYRVELGSLDLGVKWWAYGNPGDLKLDASNSSLPPSESAKIVARQSIHEDFLVVESLPKPPSVSISMSLSSNVLHRSGSPRTVVRVTVTNKTKSPVTIRSTGDQHFIGPFHGSPSDSNSHRITSIEPSPSLSNLSIVKCSTGEDFSPQPRHTCSLTVGRFGGYSRRGLMTLEPDVPLLHEFALLGRANAIVRNMGDDDEFVVKLRPLGVWWFPGTLDEIFDGEKTIQRMPGGPRLPLILHCEDQLRFRLED